MFTAAEMHAWTANCPEWKYVPSPMFWKMCSTSVKGACPIHWAPSPPIWVRPVTSESVRDELVTNEWQPIPPPASEPSGTAVDRLWGHPEQKYGVRLVDSTVSSSEGGLAAATATRFFNTLRRGVSKRAAVSSPSGGISRFPSVPRLPMTWGADGP